MAIDVQSVWSLIVCALAIVPVSVHEFMDQYLQEI